MTDSISSCLSDETWADRTIDCVWCWLQRSVRARSPEFQWSPSLPPSLSPSLSIQQLRLSCLSWRRAKPPIQMSAGSHAPLDVATDRLRCHSVSVARIAQRDRCSTRLHGGAHPAPTAAWNPLASGLITRETSGRKKKKEEEGKKKKGIGEELCRSRPPDWTLPLSLATGRRWVECAASGRSRDVTVRLHIGSLTTSQHQRVKIVRIWLCVCVWGRGDGSVWQHAVNAAAAAAASAERAVNHSWIRGAMPVGTEPPSASSRQHQRAPSVCRLWGSSLK